MKKSITLNKAIFLIFISIFFLTFSHLKACGCKCGTYLVKFEWKGNQFVPEGGESKGIEITDVVFKPGEENEPMEVSWISNDWYICAVEVKHGKKYKTTYYNPHASSGISSSTSKHAISYLLFCADEPLPVEMTSFSIQLKNDIAELEWQTATEVNNYGFEVERQYQKSDYYKDWEKIGFVEGHGNSNSPKLYSFTDPSISLSGKYFYRLKQIDIDGKYEYSDVVEIEFNPPIDYRLNQNYPNPFNPSTTISYSIPTQSFVKLIIYNLFGEEVTKLVNERKEAGSYSVSYNGSNIASGVYIYTLETEKFKATKRFILLK